MLFEHWKEVDNRIIIFLVRFFMFYFYGVNHGWCNRVVYTWRDLFRRMSSLLPRSLTKILVSSFIFNIHNAYIEFAIKLQNAHLQSLCFIFTLK